MGIKPPQMTQLSYPAEWLIDIFNAPSQNKKFVYVFDIPRPPVPWILDWGWSIIGATLLIGSVAVYFLR